TTTRSAARWRRCSGCTSHARSAATPVACGARPEDERHMSDTMRAIRVHAPGGPEALRLEELPRPEPSRGEVLVRVAAAGGNFLDVYQRTGLYPVPLPFTPGNEAAGF